MQLVTNTIVAGRFRLNRQLGRGGMGSVWHATHLGLDIPCAVKFIEGEYAQLPEAQARFEREAKAAAALRSPHVVQILDHNIWEGTPYIAMELLDGEDLGKRLTRMGRIPPREVNTIVTQVCRALQKAHTLGIVHRDLKPDNVFLVKDDDREIVKVLDFGIAKQNRNALDGSNTKTGAMLGTPYYMSPEQAQGTKAVDARSDLWSLAVIVFQCVTGRLPFESDALGDLLVKIIVAPVPIPSQVNADIPPGFDQWWAKASAREAAHRFQTAREFAESLALVFGISQVTEVMDRGRLPAPAGSDAQVGGGTVALPMGTPPGYGGVGHQGGAFTPQPGMHRPMQMTPHPHAQSAGGVTPAPIAHTFGGSEVVPKKAPIGLAIGGGLAAAALLGGVIALVMVMKGGKEVPSGAAGPGPSITATATVAPTSTAQPTDTSTQAAGADTGNPSATAAPPPTTSPSASAAASAVATVRPVPPGGPAGRNNGGAKPPVTPPAGKPNAGKGDLGF
jgi:Protein kinase domain